MNPRKPKADPVFALIAQHREAEKARAKASRTLDRVRRQVEKREGWKANTVHSLMNAFPPMSIGTDSVVKFAGNIPSHVHNVLHSTGRQLGPKARRKIIALRMLAEDELQAMYRRHLRDHIKAQKVAGIEAALAESGRAVERAEAALRKLSGARPRTREGAVALLDYFGNIVERGVTLYGNLMWAGKPMRELAAVLQAKPESRPAKST